MNEGTKSYLFGCHHFFIHPLLVLIAWIKEYKTFPKFWELICIFLHDIGHVGKQYLSDPKEKQKHWMLGADIAYKLFGLKGFYLIAGHTTQNSHPRSKLFIPDKKSWLIAPNWWLWLNYKIEDFQSEAAKPKAWKALVSENVKNGYPKGNHEMYLESKDMKNGKQD